MLPEGTSCVCLSWAAAAVEHVGVATYTEVSEKIRDHVLSRLNKEE